MKVIEVRLAISKLIRSIDVTDAATFMVHVFHSLSCKEDPSAPRVVGKYDDDGVIHVRPKDSPWEDIVVIMGYKIWRDDDRLFFEKIEYLEWERRILYQIVYNSTTLEPVIFNAETITKGKRSQTGKLGRETHWCITS